MRSTTTTRRDPFDAGLAAIAATTASPPLLDVTPTDDAARDNWALLEACRELLDSHPGVVACRREIYLDRFARRASTSRRQLLQRAESRLRSALLTRWRSEHFPVERS